MGLSKKQLKLLEARKSSKPKGNSPGDHNRRRRSFVDVKCRGYCIRFYPIKNWQRYTGIHQQTFRNWINKGHITAFKQYNMYVMCEAELEALSNIVKTYHSRNKHSELTEEQIQAYRQALLPVRHALREFQEGSLLTQEQADLLRPSIQLASKEIKHATTTTGQEIRREDYND